jgi:hypothetical protein
MFRHGRRRSPGPPAAHPRRTPAAPPRCWIASGPTAAVLRDDAVIRAYLGLDQ